ncbi:MAG: hypothetical protein QJR04_25160 [Burkholderia multivorans]|nr:hypothetical protein [Burkholderia multivorans]
MDAFDYFTRLERKVRRSGFTMTTVCRRARIQPALISRWRARLVEPRLSTLSRLEAALEELRAEME